MKIFHYFFIEIIANFSVRSWKFFNRTKSHRSNTQRPSSSSPYPCNWFFVCLELDIDNAIVAVRTDECQQYPRISLFLKQLQRLLLLSATSPFCAILYSSFFFCCFVVDNVDGRTGGMLIGGHSVWHGKPWFSRFLIKLLNNLLINDWNRLEFCHVLTWLLQFFIELKRKC